MRFSVLGEFLYGFPVLEVFSFGFSFSNIPQCPPLLKCSFHVAINALGIIAYARV